MKEHIQIKKGYFDNPKFKALSPRQKLLSIQLASTHQETDANGFLTITLKEIAGLTSMRIAEVRKDIQYLHFKGLVQYDSSKNRILITPLVDIIISKGEAE